MKKTFLGILTLVYMTVSSGIAMEIHYCMGKRAGVDYFGISDDKCGKCGMKATNKGCCHDEHKFVKLEDSHKNVYNDISFAVDKTALLHRYPAYNWQLADETTVAQVNIHAPPELTGPPANVMNCVFRL
jgi:hypothetical protein